MLVPSLIKPWLVLGTLDLAATADAGGLPVPPVTVLTQLVTNISQQFPKPVAGYSFS